jgi:RNA binding exosome subunit
MYTTYHFNSAEEINQDIIDSIRATYKTRPINITVVEEDRVEYLLSDEQKAILDERLLEDTSDYIPAEVLLKNLRERYGL